MGKIYILSGRIIGEIWVNGGKEGRLEENHCGSNNTMRRSRRDKEGNEMERAGNEEENERGNYSKQ